MDQSGSTQRSHLEQVYKATGKMPEELKQKPFPSEVKYLWEVFISISSGRQTGYSGPLPISFTEIKSWCELTGCNLSPVEVDVIKKLDNLYVRTMNG